MMAAHPLALRPGMTVGPWRVLAQLGTGSFGIVFLVEHAGQRHALKFALHGPGSDDLNRTDARATRELACLLQAVHPNVVRVWAHGRWPDARTGYHYVVMDHVEGTTLARWVTQEHPTPRRVARLFARLARALGELHARNVFHRDLKPSNILVRAADEEPVLVDFGSADHAESLPLTEGSMPPGTPQYRSPEALRFHRDNHARRDAHYPFRATDDLYALGVTLYEVLAGVPAFSPTLPREVLVEHIETRLPPRPSEVNPRVPLSLDAIALRLVRKRPVDRFPNGEALHAALEEALRGASPAWDEPLLPAASGRAQPAEAPARSFPAPAQPSHAASAVEAGPPAPRAAAPSRRHLPPAIPRSSSWNLLGAGLLLGLVALLGWGFSRPQLAPELPRTAQALAGSSPSTPPPAGAPEALLRAGPGDAGAGAGPSTADASTDAGLPGPILAAPPTEATPSPTTREQTVTNPTPAGAPTPPAASSLGTGKRTLPKCLAGMAAAASLHCATTPPRPGDQPRKGEPCSEVALANMKEVLDGVWGAGNYEFPLTGGVQLDFHQDYADGDNLIGGLRTGPIYSVVRQGGALPIGSRMHGWVWVDGPNAEIQWYEAGVPEAVNWRGGPIALCARSGNLKRRTVAHGYGHTKDKPVWLRTDAYTLVDKW